MSGVQQVQNRLLREMKVYLFNNWHNGDIITNRALIKELLKFGLDMAVGSYKDRHYLVADLPVLHIVSDHHEDFQRGSPCLSTLCPEGYLPINTWCGTFKDIDQRGFHNWITIVDTFNRQAEQYELGITLSSLEVPMIDFEHRCLIKVRPRSIYVENGDTRGGHSMYSFNMTKIGRMFPELSFYCTAFPDCDLPNVVNCNNRNLVELSGISNQCEAIVGKGSGPFLCTYTEPNRLKPRAVMKFTAPKFWQYRNNPLRYLESDEELYQFLTEVRNTSYQCI